MGMFFLFLSSLANRSKGGPPAAWQGPDLKNIQNRIQKHFATSPVSVVREITERMLHYPVRHQLSRMWGSFIPSFLGLVSGHQVLLHLQEQPVIRQVAQAVAGGGQGLIQAPLVPAF